MIGFLWSLYIHTVFLWCSDKIKSQGGLPSFLRSILLVPLMIPGNSRCESAFSVPSWIWSCFCENHEKISFSRPEFVDSEIVIWELTSLTDLSNRLHLLLKKVKTYLRSTMGNNWQHALMFIHVNKNMLHNINLADVSKDFFFFSHRKDSRKQTFGHFSQNYS